MEFLHKNRVIHLDIKHNNIVFASADAYSLKIKNVYMSDLLTITASLFQVDRLWSFPRAWRNEQGKVEHGGEMFVE